MFELVAFDEVTIVGSVIVFLALGFLRFGNQFVNLLVSFRSSPVETVERSMIEQE